MSTDKNLDEVVKEANEALETFGSQADITLKRLKKIAKRQRIKMRKRGIRLIQDYCN